MYIIKAKYKIGDVYFVDFFTEPNTNSKFKLLSLTFEDAKHFSNLKIATKSCIELNDDNFKIYNICPSCNQEYTEPPAISRRDNKTYICSNCGMREALFDFIKKGA